MYYAPLNQFGAGSEPYTETHRTVIELDVDEFKLVDCYVLWGEGRPPAPGYPGPETFMITRIIDATSRENYLPYLSRAQIDALEYEIWDCRHYEDDQYYLNADPWPEHPAKECRDYC